MPTSFASRDERLSLHADMLPAEPLPPPGPRPFFSILDNILSEELTQQINHPFWIDTVGNSGVVEIRVQLDDMVLRVFARRSQAYASNSHIFIVWMVGTSLILLTIAIPFLRNQIKPISALAEAAESFGKGRPMPRDFGRAAPKKCGARALPSSRCASASSGRWSSARRC